MGLAVDLLKNAAGEGSLHNALGRWRLVVSLDTDALAAALPTSGTAVATLRAASGEGAFSSGLGAWRLAVSQALDVIPISGTGHIFDLLIDSGAPLHNALGRWRQSLSREINNAAWTPLLLDSPTPPTFWYSAADHVEAVIHRIGDNTRNGRSMTSGAAGFGPAVTDGVVGTQRGFVFATSAPGSRVVVPGTYPNGAGYWKAWHDGTGSTFGIRFQTTGTAAVQVLCATALTLTSAGFYLSHDGVNDRIVFQIRNATVPVFTYTGANGSCTRNEPHLLIVRFSAAATPQISIWLDGVEVASGPVLAAPLAAAASELAIGTLVGFTSPYAGAISQFTGWQRYLSESETEALNARLPGVGPYRTVRVVWPIGESTIQNASSERLRLHWNFLQSGNERVDFVGSAPPTGQFPLPNQAHEGWSGETIDQVKARVQAASVTGVTDIIIMEGTNDCVAEDMTSAPVLAAAMVRLGQLMTAAEVGAPDAERKFLSAIPPSTSGVIGPRVNAYNAGQAILAASRGWTWIPLEAGPFALVATDISGDTIHPTASTPPSPFNAGAGYDKIGNTWAAGIGLNLPAVTALDFVALSKVPI